MSKLLGATILLMAVAVAGCDDDRPVRTWPELETAWPHADGTAWTYHMTFNAYDAPVADWSDGELPPPGELLAELRRDIGVEPVTTFEALYSLAFDGAVTTGPGVTVQHLVETVEPLGGDAAGVGRMAAGLKAALRDGDKTRILPSPLLLGGYAFAFEDSGFYGYGELYREHSWTYLEGPLRPGSAFSLQLARGVADGVWLHGVVQSVEPRLIDGVAYDDVVECLYVVDMGEQVIMNPWGDPAGTIRQFIYGLVHYAPGVGPVACLERANAASDPVLQDSSPSRWEYRCRLESVSLPD